MIMCSYKVIAISNRKLCSRTLLEQIDIIGKSHKVDILILREKDLLEDEYEALAREVIKKCDKYNIECILHNYIDVAIRLGYKKIHLPMSVFKENRDKLNYFDVVGTSIHSIEEARLAEEYGASYVTAGHIFKTDCKKGLEPRGLGFLRDVCNAVSINVYGIGGINKDNIKNIIEAGAKGGCIMSGFMRCI